MVFELLLRQARLGSSFMLVMARSSGVDRAGGGVRMYAFLFRIPRAPARARVDALLLS